jgi:hypothetical protein
VGVAPGHAVCDGDFKEQLETLNEELETLNAEACELEHANVLRLAILRARTPQPGLYCADADVWACPISCRRAAQYARQMEASDYAAAIRSAQLAIESNNRLLAGHLLDKHRPTGKSEIRN